MNEHFLVRLYFAVCTDTVINSNNVKLYAIAIIGTK